ncbi:MAG: soluble NSF attachment family protein [Puniceicoccales bacterium]|nr:soluble NSF attachment family protein [Puniceicoccales bacterium]
MPIGASTPVATKPVLTLLQPAPKPVSKNIVSALPREPSASRSKSENSDAKNNLHSNLFKNWEKMADVSSVTSLTPQTIAKEAFQKGDFLMATAALKDQSQTGSPEWKFANRILESVEQGIREKLPTALKELNRFSEKNKFDARELKWIEFLAGKDVEGLRYKNCQAFRNDTDNKLEGNHDYVQVVFPSWSPSRYFNKDLYISRNVKTWKALLKDCPNIRRNIQLNMQLNAIRMLHFWKFHFAFQGDRVILEDNSQSPLHEDGNHNTLRATRFIRALRMFRCRSLLNVFKILLEEHYKNSSSYQKWSDELKKPGHLISVTWAEPLVQKVIR